MAEETKETHTTESDFSDLNTDAAKGFTFFIVGLISLLSISLLVFYSTVRARSIGIATGYLKAVELGYQNGEYNFKNLPAHSFDTGMYKVNISSNKATDENGSLVVKVQVQDKFFMVTHYSEQLKLIPTLEAESEK